MTRKTERVTIDKAKICALPGCFSPLDFDLFGWLLSQPEGPGDLP
jgi:hypothetical protein